MKIIEVPSVELSEGDILVRIDPGLHRAVLIGEFLEWFNRPHIASVRNPVGVDGKGSAERELVTEMPERQTILKL